MTTKRIAYNVALLLALILLLAGGYIMIWRPAGMFDEEPVARSYEDQVWLRVESVAVSATGTNGAALGSASTDRNLHGYIYAVHLDFTSGISATTDITLSQASPALTILQVSNLYTDTWYYPAVQQAGSTGSGTSTYEKALAADAVDITVGETTSGTVGTVTIYWGQ